MTEIRSSCEDHAKSIQSGKARRDRLVAHFIRIKTTSTATYPTATTRASPLTTHAPGEAFVTTAPTYKQIHAVLW